MEAHGATGLALLPEELVDLVCSFVVDFEVQDTITTLCSLALTSRQFLEPARRALLHDPSRILSTRSPVHPEYLLHRIIRQPELGRHVKRLDGIVDLFDHEDLFYHRKPVFVFTNWAFTLMRSCPNLFSVVIWPNLDDGWLDELLRLPRLRHVGIQARYSDFYEDDYDYRPFDTLRAICQRGLSLDSLASSCDFEAPPHLSAVAPRVASVYLDHVRYGILSIGKGVDLTHVRHLSIRAQSLHAMVRLPCGLETLSLEKCFPATVPVNPHYPEDDLCWADLFGQSDRFGALRSVRLANVLVRRADFAQLCAAAPNLERLELRECLWCDGYLCRPEQDAALVEALSGLPRLRFLHLGEVPYQGETIPRTRNHCRLFGLEADDSTQDRLISFFSSSSPTPSLSSDRSSSSSRDHVVVPSFPSHPGLRRTPSPTPPPDDADLAASATTIVARTTADTQQYVDAPAAQPRLEPGFEAQDDGVDDELDDAAPWDGWGSECEMSEADRAWCECDDEGVWECTRALVEEG
ncbi:uncharacterized protein RHOBADRAFT_43237 [Rhodotorula graminis WP1]|uniref:Uncharacterized protein n=1 Tax=Rhodotorula graminis (strain WP1) TaxID=578459 RepID=A0A194S4Z9_RHOGW|nr:uncharacterized protein RHOBADRAFT_43237 [Rhodotorula graminis WP1]KPV75813.1 hypothetical protein RHOBADRAFT_43237 [Rhodotorula graminis WP1]